MWNYATPLPTMCVVRMGGNDVRYFVYSPAGELLYSIEADSGVHHYYHYDEAGNTPFLTDAGGSIAAAYAYSPFGEMLGSTGVVANPFTWQGRHGAFREADTGLYYLRARFYDSRTARFVSRDPVHSMDPLRVNPYQYALNNPLRYIDPTGLDVAVGWSQWRGGVYSDGLIALDNPIEERGLTGVKYGGRIDTDLFRGLLNQEELNIELNPQVFSGLQFNANFAFTYTLLTDERESKIQQLERELMELGQGLPPMERMRMGGAGGWNAQDPTWYQVGAYFGEAAAGLTQATDFGINLPGRGLDVEDPLSRMDAIRRELERCRRGPPPPVDVGNFDLDFDYELRSGATYRDRSLSLQANYSF